MPQPQELSTRSVSLPSDDTFKFSTQSAIQSAIQSATNLGSIAGLMQVSGTVSRDDRSDYYRLRSMGGRLAVELAGMTGDADLEIFNSQLHKVGSASQSGNLNEWMTIEDLTAGDYYIHVRHYSGTVNYQMSLMGTLVPPSLQDLYEVNNTIATAHNLGELMDTQSLEGYVGFGDEVDYYRFLVSQDSNLSLVLTGLSGDLDLQIFQDNNQNFRLDDQDFFFSSTRALNTPEQLELQNLAPGQYYLKIYPSGTVSSSYRLNLQSKLVPKFSTFEIEDASGDGSASNVFEQGALRVTAKWLGDTKRNPLVNLRIDAIAAAKTIEIANWNKTVFDNSTNNSINNALINLAKIPIIQPGNYQIRSIATFQNGETIFSQSRSLTVSAWVDMEGTLAADELDASAGLAVGKNAIVWGKGGTDSLKLGVLASEVVSLNGRSLLEYQPIDTQSLTDSSSLRSGSLVIFGGTTFDYLRLKSGREIYFQGIESLQFLDRPLELQVRTNDPGFKDQWNLQISDVTSAWRFTQGDPKVLLVSLDTGILTALGGSGGIVDLDLTRLISDPTDDDNYKDGGHGHRSISIMSAIANNASGIAGINWKSNVLVHDVYGGGLNGGNRISFHQSIRQTLQYAQSNNLKVVFQGGMQGEYWLTDGGTQAELEQMIRESEVFAFYAIAAGNGNVDIDLTDTSNNAVKIGTSGGLARLQEKHQNLASVGAATPFTIQPVNGLSNPKSIDRAGYSNFGKNLTLMAPTNVPAIDKLGKQVSFGGTSAANPNLAAIASLVWSTNLNLTAVALRQILIETAMDMGVVGRDDWTGYGLVNADAAVRRAIAIARNPVLSGF